MDSDWIWYILHFCTFSFYGGIVDTIKNSIKKKKENKMMTKIKTEYARVYYGVWDLKTKFLKTFIYRVLLK